MKKILIIQATFYQNISALLLAGATKKITELGYEFEVITVPGALEIPAVIAFVKESKKYVGYIALGCVIRGETSHYDIVAGESAWFERHCNKSKIANCQRNSYRRK